MKRGALKGLMILDYIAIFVGLFLSGGNKTALTWIFIVGIAIAFVLNNLLRCPNCGSIRNRFLDSYCRDCGEKLEDK